MQWPFKILALCGALCCSIQGAQCDAPIATQTNAASPTASSPGAFFQGRGERGVKLRWQLHVAQSDFSLPLVQGKGQTAPQTWRSDESWGRNGVVMIVAPRPVPPSQCGCYTPSPPVPPIEFLQNFATLAREFKTQNIATVFAAPNDEAAQSVARMLASEIKLPSSGSSNASQSPNEYSNDASDLLVALDAPGEMQPLVRSDSPKPSLVVFDRAGFVRRAETTGDWASLLQTAKTLEFSKPLTVGERAPDFVVSDMNGTKHRLSSYAGQNLLLTFFPKCFTGHCSNHLTSLQGVASELEKTNTRVLAVSVDPAEGETGQIAFAKSLGLSFPLIPDVGRNLSLLYGAAETPQERAARLSVLIDRAGVVRWIDKEIVVKTHGADVLAKIKELKLDFPLPTPTPALDETS